MCAEGRARKPSRLQGSSPTVSSGPSVPNGELIRALSLWIKQIGEHMHAIVRRYEGIDEKRTDELSRKVGESLTPRLRKLDGFGGYFLIEAENGVMSSVNFYDTSAHADESTRVVAEWLREEKLEQILPNPPKITGGKVIVEAMPGVSA